MTLEFLVGELNKELVALRSIAADFLSPSAGQQLYELESQLTGISRSVSGLRPWQIPEDDPIRTRMSEGEYQSGGGEKFVYGELSFIWEVLPLRPSGDGRPARTIELAGKASTMLKIVEGDPDDPTYRELLAMWRIEVGNDDSPGTHFHVQVMGHEIDPPFPRALDVPRLPSILVSPFACLEYLLSELFQVRWHRHASKERGDMTMWRSIQLDRFLRQLSWHMDEVGLAGSGSPWLAIKLAKPPADLFVRDFRRSS